MTMSPTLWVKPLPASPRSWTARTWCRDRAPGRPDTGGAARSRPRPALPGERLISAIETCALQTKTRPRPRPSGDTLALLDVVDARTSSSNSRMNGPSAAEALLSLALPSSSAERPSTSRRLTSLPSVAPTILPVLAAITAISGSGLFQVDTGCRPTSAPKPTDAIGWHLVKISASGPMPTSRYCDQAPRAISSGLDLHRLRRAGLQLRQVVADQRGDVGADGVGLFGRAARLLLDDALEQADDEGDARRLDRLQVDRATAGRRLAGSRGASKLLAAIASTRADRLALGVANIAGRIRHLADVAHGRRRARGDVEDRAVAHRDHQRMGRFARPGAAEEDSLAWNDCTAHETPPSALAVTNPQRRRVSSNR